MPAADARSDAAGARSNHANAVRDDRTKEVRAIAGNVGPLMGLVPRYQGTGSIGPRPALAHWLSDQPYSRW